MDTNSPITRAFVDHLSACCRYEWCDKLSNGYRKLKWFMPESHRTDIDANAVIEQRQALSALYSFLLGCSPIEHELFPVSHVERWDRSHGPREEGKWNTMVFRVSSEMFEHIRKVPYKPNPFGIRAQVELAKKKGHRSVEECVEHEEIDLDDLYHSAAIHHIRILAAKWNLYMSFSDRPGTWPKGTCHKMIREFEIIAGSCDDFDGKIGQQVLQNIYGHLQWVINDKAPHM